MAYTDPRGLPFADQGELLTTLMQFTRSDFTAAGTSDPAEGDIVTLGSTAGNYYIKMAADNATGRLGRVTKLVKTGASGAVGQCVVEWLDVQAFVAVACDDATTATLGNSTIKDGNTTVANNFDGGATTGPLVDRKSVV